MQRKNQMDFKLKVSRRGAKSNKRISYIKNITKLYDAPHEVIKIYKDYSTTMHNGRYHAMHRK